MEVSTNMIKYSILMPNSMKSDNSETRIPHVPIFISKSHTKDRDTDLIGQIYNYCANES